MPAKLILGDCSLMPNCSELPAFPNGKVILLFSRRIGVRIRRLLRRMSKLKRPMNTIAKPILRGYELLIASGNLLQSPLLLVLRAYFFWQLFMTGRGHLANIGKVSELFVSLGIPFPTLNAYLSSSVECFGSLLLIVGLASRLTAIPVAVTMVVAYLTADLEAVANIFNDP